MLDENPYQSPGEFATEPGDPTIKQLEKAFSTRMLEARESGFSLGLFYRWIWKPVFYRTVILGLTALALASLEYWNFFCFMGGFYLGMSSYEFGMARARLKLWPIHVRVMNWEKIQRMADGELVV